MAQENVNRQITSPPTFLKHLLLDENEIILVHKPQDDVEDKEESVLVVPNKDNSCIDNLELTGTPLEIDLKGEVTLDTTGQCDRGNSWTTEEAKLYPIPLDTARQLLNDQNFSDDPQSLSTYCLCEPNADENKINLGNQITKSNMITSFVECLGCFPRDHHFFDIKYMESEHLDLLNRDSKIDYLLLWKYVLYGYNLQGVKSLDNSECVGYLGVEVTNTDPNSNTIIWDRMRMYTQIIAGHEMSNVHFLWQELCKLQNYLDILNSDNQDPDQIINKSYKSIDEILDELNQLLNDVGFLVEQEMCKEFDLQNLRQAELLDKLWDILKYCKDLSTLRDCFISFFEELTSVNIRQISDTDNTSIAVIVRGIMKGTLAVPTVSFTQALELLFELGSEKLFKDYLVIINNFHAFAQDNILQKWNQYSKDVSTETIKRKTRLTMRNKGAMTESSVNTSKLGYLGQMHITVELIYLLKHRSEIPEASFQNACEHIFNQFLNKKSKDTEFMDLQMQRLVEFDFGLRLDKPLVDKSCLESYTVKMTTTKPLMQVTTVFHMSANPIFPPSIYMPDDLTDEQLFYLSKFVKYSYTI